MTKLSLDEARSSCPLACTLDLVGDRWTLLVLRDLFLGMRHYDELQQSQEGIASNVLADRLKRLQALEMITCEVEPENRRRRRYELTERGRSFAPVLLALAHWGLKHIDGTRAAPDVRAALLADKPGRS